MTKMTLKMLRVSKNWNQETAAKKLRISVSKLSNWENA
ncbi:TPA: helix-turn-helix transcriptional regulator, partial [Streptococcus pyogenes]|nr:helix-turn-helix transcriptional regulator [Streptococcus pyogenes]